MQKALFLLSVIGWIAAITVHFLSIDVFNVSMQYPLVEGALHIGIFVVWFPVVLKLKREKSGLFKALFKNTPPMLKPLVIAGMIYMPLNFVLAFNTDNTTRLFSAQWIAFYGMSMGIQYPFKSPAVL